jgi:uncharacterized protein (DUF983 family)
MAAESRPWRDRLWAIARLRCPACREGKVFRGLFETNNRCPVCGLQFMRETGYFLGAMYFSYALAIPLILIFTGIVYLLAPHWPLYVDLVVAWMAFLPFVAPVYRYSRVMWLHFDRYFDPE